MDSELPFTMVVDDPSGNSFVENPSAPNKDPALKVKGRQGSADERALRTLPSRLKCACVDGTVDCCSSGHEVT